MPTSLFISYSTFDGAALAEPLYKALRAKPRTFVPWLDKHGLRASRLWGVQLREAIRACDALLFLASTDSVEAESGCRLEYQHAIRYRKPVVPLLLHRGIELPYELEGVQYLDFTGDFKPALRQLCDHLAWLASPAGQLQQLNTQRAHAVRDQRRGRPKADVIAALQQDIDRLESALRDPGGTAVRLELDIRRDLDAERSPPVSPVRARKRVNSPPMATPAYFQNRNSETRLVGEWLRDENVRLVWVVGRGGVGKTTLACRLLQSLEDGELPDVGGSVQVDGVVYLGPTGSRPITFQNLLADLCTLLPGGSAPELVPDHSEPGASTEAKIRALLHLASGRRIVVLLDGFEAFVDPASRTTADPDLRAALGELLRGPHHGIKVVATTRLVPSDLPRIEPGRHSRLDLDEGLLSPHAEDMLRALDADGTIGLRDTPREFLAEARVRTRGFPKALVTLYSILSIDRDTSLREVLSSTEGRLPEEVLTDLVGEAFGRLDPVAQSVMQAVAVYRRPVPAVAVNFLLQPYLGLDAKPILGRLVNMKLLHKEGDCYHLHPVDRDYVLPLVPRGDPADRKADSLRFTRSALFHRAADYYQQARKDASDVRAFDDLAAPLAEFELRCAGEEFDAAARLLNGVEDTYIRLGGHLQPLIGWRERLAGNLADPALARHNTGRLGQLYRSVGRVREAIGRLEVAAREARAAHDSRYTAQWLGELAHCHNDAGDSARAAELCEEALGLADAAAVPQLRCNLLGLRGHLHGSAGEPARAIPFYEAALALARDAGTPEWACANLNGLAHSYFSLGRVPEARAHAERALEVARGHNLRLWLSANLNLLSNCLADLGETGRAIECLREALRVARETGQRAIEAYRLLMLALALAGEGDLTEALALAREGEAMTNVVEQRRLPQYCSFALAQIHFHHGDLAAARAAAEAAGGSPFPESLHNAAVLLGVVAFKQGDRTAAVSAFERAVATADDTLARNPRNPNALDCKGLGCTGLLACGRPEMLRPALDAYRAARALNSYPGLVRSVARWLDALIGPDPTPPFDEVRRAALGG
jgi:tetratricopeptide (TPR) repeat protein